MKKYLISLSLLISLSPSFAQSIESPSQFLGYQPGEKFTPHYRVIEYFNYVASASAKTVKVVAYGKTYENRPLIVAFVGSENNISRLEDIRNNNIRLSGLQEGPADLNGPAIIWLSYNVHGNEPASTEASMQTLYDLANPDNTETKAWLKNTLVIIDPCINPDGRERYVNFISTTGNKIADPAPYTREHLEP